MNIKYSYIRIYLLLFSFIFVIYSKGQDQTIISNTLANDTLLKGNQTIETPWIDPLFFIEGQLCQHLRKIFQDKSGNLWFGTNNYGIMRYDGETLKFFDKKNGFNFSRITGIVEDEEGNVWFGTYQGLIKYNPSNGEPEFTNFTEEDGLLNNEIWSLIIDRNGVFWIGTNEGVSRFDGTAFSAFPIPKAEVQDTTTIYSYDRITCILEDRNGSLWFGTDGFGITRYDPTAAYSQGGKTFTHITMEDGLSDNTTHDLMEDSKGNIWIGTFFGGVSMYDPSANLKSGGKIFTNFTMDGVISGVEVGGFFEDSKGNIWFAAENAGVYRYDGNSFTNFSEDDGLITNGILSIYEDKKGRFWFGGWGGLFRYDPSAEEEGGKSFFPVTKEGPWQ